VLLGLATATGCGSSPQRQPPGLPPTPASISVAEPGGDAFDPSGAALERLLEARWGRRGDKDNQLRVPLLDWRHWKRVRYWGVEHFLGFRYGDEHHALAISIVLDEADPSDSGACLRRFEAWARPQLRGFEFELEPAVTRESSWKGKPLVVRATDGYVDFALKRHEFSAAWASYAAYPDACLVYAIAVPWGDHPELARKVRDRFFEEAFERVRPLTKVRPTRS
jgi:hypothetical protein